jgi:hypothetical protein
MELANLVHTAVICRFSLNLNIHAKLLPPDKPKA